MDTEITVTASGLALSGPLLAGERVAVSVSGVSFAEGAKPTLVLLSRFPDALLASVELTEGEEGSWSGVLDTATRQVGGFFATARADERRDAVLELIDANGETRESVARLLVPFCNSALCPSPMHAQPAASVYVAGPPGQQGPAATIEAGEVTTLPPGSPATVTNTGTPNAAVFAFGIPQGEPGSIPLPVSVSNGGTGATTAAGARANLGAVNKAGDTMSGALTAQGFTAKESGSSFTVNPASGVFTTLEHPGILTVTETSGGAASVAFLPGTTAAAANPGKTIAIGSDLAAKQDTISDLATIRSGAAAGATAVQPSAMPASETWTFTVDDGQGGTTTVTKNVAVYAAQSQGAGA